MQANYRKCLKRASANIDIVRVLGFVDGDGEALGQQEEALFDPILAVFEGLTSVAINAAEEGAPHAALHAVIGAGTAGRDERSACDGHASNMTRTMQANYRKCLKRASGNIDIVRVLGFLLPEPAPEGFRAGWVSSLRNSFLGRNNAGQVAIGAFNTYLHAPDAFFEGIAAIPQMPSSIYSSIKTHGVGETARRGLSNTVEGVRSGFFEIAHGTNGEARGEALFTIASAYSGLAFTRAGAVANEVAAGPANFMGSADDFYRFASRRADIDPAGHFDVVAHGNSMEIEVMTASGPVTVNQRVAARLIQQSPGYNGQPIRLLSCETGACDIGFAQNLANKMNVPVQAPTDLVWAYGNGQMVVAPRLALNPRLPEFNMPDLTRQGTFQTFTPKRTYP